MWPNSQFPADLVTFTKEVLNGKLNFLLSVNYAFIKYKQKFEEKINYRGNSVKERASKGTL